MGNFITTNNHTYYDYNKHINDYRDDDYYIQNYNIYKQNDNDYKQNDDDYKQSDTNNNDDINLLTKNYIIQKYYLERLFKNIIDDTSPKHYLYLKITNINNLTILYVRSILYKLIIIIHEKNKLFIKNNTETLEKTFIYGLYIIDNYQINHIVDDKINKFYLLMIDIIKTNIYYNQIIDNIYNDFTLRYIELLLNKKFLNNDKNNNIIQILNLLSYNDIDIDIKLDIIYFIIKNL